MEQIDGNEVTPAGDLNLDPNRNIPRATVDCLFLDPIYAAGFPLNPSTGGCEPVVDHRADGACAIAISLLFDQQLEPSYDRADFCEEFIETKAGNEIWGSVE